MRNALIRALPWLLSAKLFLGCGPQHSDDGGPSADDVAWVFGEFARAGDCDEDHITLCLSSYYYEYEFREDGTLQAYEVTCGMRKPPDPRYLGRWLATDDYGVVDILPPEGSESFKLPQANVEHGTVTLTDDCLVVELKHNLDDPRGVPLDRGQFRYEAGGCAARAFYLGNEPPDCPEPSP